MTSPISLADLRDRDLEGLALLAARPGVVAGAPTLWRATLARGDSTLGR
jgi:hypothetical protein